MLTKNQTQSLVKRQRWLRAFAIVFTLLTGVLLAGSVILTIMGCVGSDLAEVALVFLAGAAFTIVGLLITFYRPENRVGWILVIAGFGTALQLALPRVSLVRSNESAGQSGWLRRSGSEREAFCSPAHRLPTG